MARFVLVHGGWHGGCCFRWLAEELANRGHDVTAPDLPCEEIGLTPLDYARAVGPQPDAIVIGHSLAGFTIPHIEAGLRVYLGALPPLERREINEAFAEGFDGVVHDTDGRTYWPDADTAAARMYPDCSRAQSDWAFRQLRRQARLEPIPAPFGPGDIVIATLQDAAVDPDWQIHTARTYGARMIELDSGHSPFFPHPAELRNHSHLARLSQSCLPTTGVTARGRHFGALAQPSDPASYRA